MLLNYRKEYKREERRKKSISLLKWAFVHITKWALWYAMGFNGLNEYTFAKLETLLNCTFESFKYDIFSSFSDKINLNSHLLS